MKKFFQKPVVVWGTVLVSTAVTLVGIGVYDLCHPSKPAPAATALDGPAKADFDTVKSDVKKASDAVATLPDKLSASEKRVRDDVVDLLKPFDTRLKAVEEKKPAPPASKSAVRPPATPPATKKAPEIPTSVLLKDLMSSDLKPRGTALTAVNRLVIRAEAIPEIVTAYANGDAETKKRTRFVINLMAEPFRQWKSEVITHPTNFSPAVETAISELTGALKELVPIPGPRGPQGPKGKDGALGQDGLPGKDGAPGRDGTSVIVEPSTILIPTPANTPCGSNCRRHW